MTMARYTDVVVQLDLGEKRVGKGENLFLCFSTKSSPFNLKETGLYKLL